MVTEALLGCWFYQDDEASEKSLIGCFIYKKCKLIDFRPLANRVLLVSQKVSGVRSV